MVKVGLRCLLYSFTIACNQNIACGDDSASVMVFGSWCCLLAGRFGSGGVVGSLVVPCSMSRLISPVEVIYGETVGLTTRGCLVMRAMSWCGASVIRCL